MYICVCLGTYIYAYALLDVLMYSASISGSEVSTVQESISLIAFYWCIGFSMVCDCVCTLCAVCVCMYIVCGVGVFCMYILYNIQCIYGVCVILYVFCILCVCDSVCTLCAVCVCVYIVWGVGVFCMYILYIQCVCVILYVYFVYTGCVCDFICIFCVL